METTQKNNPILVAALALMTIIAGVLGFSLYNQKEVSTNQAQVIQQKTTELLATHAKLDSISSELTNKIAEVQKLGGDVSELLKVKAQLETDKVVLRRNNGASIAKYEAKIKEYESFLTQKDAEIAKLKEENGQLLANNETLNQENTSLKTNLATTHRAYKDTLNTYVAQNKELTEKVSIASALKAQNVKVAAITSKGKLKEDDENEYKAKRMEKIKVSYTLAPNPLTKQEEKEVLVRVLDPEGAVLSNGLDGSTFYWAGKEVMYTGKQKVQYNNSNQNVEWVFAKGGDRYRPGKYNVELYAEGFKIGEGNFTVK
ncbi:MAG: hypothetical protein U0Y10_01175 [Spirosomataceae bacterium]